LGLGLLEGTEGEDINKAGVAAKKKMHACMLPGPENWDMLKLLFGGDYFCNFSRVTTVTTDHFKFNS